MRISGSFTSAFAKRDSRLLSGRQFSGRPIDEFLEIELGRELRDAFRNVAHAIEPAEHGQVLPHRQTVREIDIGAFEIHSVQNAIGIARHIGAEHD